MRDHRAKTFIAIATGILLLLALTTGHARASIGEMKLFDEAYSAYLSYQPRKAIESFQRFLVDFPNSSLKDAALFWLGKSFVVIEQYADARETFHRLQREIPDSPFTPYSDRELDVLDMREKSKQALRDAEKTEMKTGSSADAARSRTLAESVRTDGEERFTALLESERERNMQLENKVRTLERQLVEIRDRLDSLHTIVSSDSKPANNSQEKKRDHLRTLQEESINTPSTKSDMTTLTAVSREQARRDQPPFTLVLIAHQETWISIRSDDREPRERMLKPGFRGTWTARKGFSVKIGNAGGVRALFNGKDIGPLGKQGEVIILKLPSHDTASPHSTS